MVDYTYYIILGAILFCLGLIGFVCRRNMILMFLCTELMLQGVALTLVGFNRHWIVLGKGLDGQAFTVFLLVVAAAEAALAMSLVLLLQRYKPTLDVDQFAEMRG